MIKVKDILNMPWNEKLVIYENNWVSFETKNGEVIPESEDKNILECEIIDLRTGCEECHKPPITFIINLERLK